MPNANLFSHGNERQVISRTRLRLLRSFPASLSFIGGIRLGIVSESCIIAESERYPL
jgi:hypothetical protein